jgi:hypothetical protein
LLQFAAALTHDLIHGLDITVALGIEQPIPEERLRIVLQTITTQKASSTSAWT